MNDDAYILNQAFCAHHIILDVLHSLSFQGYAEICAMNIHGCLSGHVKIYDSTPWSWQDNTGIYSIEILCCLIQHHYAQAAKFALHIYQSLNWYWTQCNGICSQTQQSKTLHYVESYTIDDITKRWPFRHMELVHLMPHEIHYFWQQTDVCNVCYS